MHCRFMLPLIVPEGQLHADYWRVDIVFNDGLQLNSRRYRSYFVLFLVNHRSKQAVIKCISLFTVGQTTGLAVEQTVPSITNQVD